MRSFCLKIMFSFLIFFIFLKNTQSDSRLIKIDTIIDLINYLPKKVNNEDVLVVLDWDLTIAAENGSFYPFREGGYTEAVIKYLKREGYPYFFLTGRLHGYRFQDDKDQQMGIVDAFVKTIRFINSLQFFPEILIFKDDRAFEEIFLKESEKYCLRSRWIAFAGGSHRTKTEAILHFLNNEAFIHKPKYVMFIDDVLEYHLSMAIGFMDRPEHLISLYYPPIAHPPIEQNS